MDVKVAHIRTILNLVHIGVASVSFPPLRPIEIFISPYNICL